MSGIEDLKGIGERQTLFEENAEKLERLAHRAMNSSGLQPDQFFVTCVDANDLTWTELAAAMDPNADWQGFKDRGERAITRGACPNELLGYFRETVPAIIPALELRLSPGQVRAIVCAAGGASVYTIEPQRNLVN
jgi:hypothetical protein